MHFKLPPLPNTLAEILQILKGSGMPDEKHLVHVIEKDPATAVYVLRQVNSAYYGLRRQVMQLQRAVRMLGTKRVCNLVLAVALKKSFPHMQDPMTRAVYEHIVKVSIATGAFARDLATHLQLQVAETAFTAGLLHQMGRLVFLYNVPQPYVRIWRNGSSDQHANGLITPSLATEQALFNTDHLKLGAMALQQWELPEEFVMITQRIRTLEEVIEPPLRILPLIIAIGRAASEEIFDPCSTGSFADCENSGRLTLLATLAESRNTDVERLEAFIHSKAESIHEFAQSVVDH